MANQANYDPNSFLTGGSVPAAFGENATIGTVVGGVICQPPEVKDQTDIATGLPSKWDNGDPKLQLVVTIQADGVPITEEDDGKRRFYIKGSKATGSGSLHDAVAGAVKASGAKFLEVGGTLKIKFTGTEPSKTRGFNDRKMYAAKYIPPVAKANEEFFDAPGAQTSQPAAVAAPAQVQAPAMTPEQIAAQNMAYAQQTLGATAVDTDF